ASANNDFGEKHPETTKLKSQVAYLQERINERVDGILSGLQLRLTAHQEALESLNSLALVTAWGVNVQADGTYWVGNKSMELPQLRKWLATVKGSGLTEQNFHLHLLADEKAPYSSLTRLIEVCKEMGIGVIVLANVKLNKEAMPPPHSVLLEESSEKGTNFPGLGDL